MLIDDIEILAYFTGYERSISYYRACLLPLDGEPIMVLRALDTAPFQEVAWFSQCLGYADDGDAIDAITGVMRERGWDKAQLGVDFGSHGMTVDCFQRLRKALPGHVGPITYGKGWGFLRGHLHDTPLSEAQCGDGTNRSQR